MTHSHRTKPRFAVVQDVCDGSPTELANGIVDVADQASNGSGTTITNLDVLQAVVSALDGRQPGLRRRVRRRRGAPRGRRARAEDGRPAAVVSRPVVRSSRTGPCGDEAPSPGRLRRAPRAGEAHRSSGDRARRRRRCRARDRSARGDRRRRAPRRGSQRGDALRAAAGSRAERAGDPLRRDPGRPLVRRGRRRCATARWSSSPARNRFASSSSRSCGSVGSACCSLRWTSPAVRLPRQRPPARRVHAATLRARARARRASARERSPARSRWSAAVRSTRPRRSVSSSARTRARRASRPAATSRSRCSSPPTPARSRSCPRWRRSTARTAGLRRSTRRRAGLEGRCVGATSSPASRTCSRAVSDGFQLTAPVAALTAAKHAGRIADTRLRLVGGEAAGLLLAFAVFLAATMRRREQAAWQRLTLVRRAALADRPPRDPAGDAPRRDRRACGLGARRAAHCGDRPSR